MNIVHPLMYPVGKNEYRLVKQISNGASVVVYKAICRSTKSIVAIKMLDLTSLRSIPNRFSERGFIQDLPDHPNILKPHCCFEVDGALWVVMPYVGGGSVQSIISCSFPNGLMPKSIATIVVGVLNALVAFQGRRLAHRGVKPGNILIDTNGVVKLSDFGVSSWYYQNESSLVQPGASPMPLMEPVITPPYWVPPEGMEPQWEYDNLSDIWSLGISVLEMFHGRPPVSEFPESKYALRRILKRFHFDDYYMKLKGKECAEMEKKCPFSLMKFLTGCLDWESKNRPPLQKLIDHPFLLESCRGETFLVLNVLKGLPVVEERLKPRNVPPPIPYVKYTGGKCLLRKTFQGWKFDQEKVELVALFQAGRVHLPSLDPHPGHSSGLYDYEIGLGILSIMLTKVGERQVEMDQMVLVSEIRSMENQQNVEDESHDQKSRVDVKDKERKLIQEIR